VLLCGDDIVNADPACGPTEGTVIELVREDDRRVAPLEVEAVNPLFDFVHRVDDAPVTQDIVAKRVEGDGAIGVGPLVYSSTKVLS
jgi:hypothetical protein